MHIIDAGISAGDRRADAAVSAATDAETDFQRQRMSVRVGEFGLLMPWDGAHEVTPTPPTSRLPNTAAWLRGLANVRGSLVPVVDVALALGDSRRRRADFLLICGHGDASVGLLIDGLPRAFDIGAAQSQGGPVPIPTPFDASAIALYRHEDRFWIDLDLAMLFDLLTRHLAAA